jgi:uncharacterized protein YidB (DUF937 family)
MWVALHKRRALTSPDGANFRARSSFAAAANARAGAEQEDTMGYLDDAMKNAVPGGNIAKPLMIAAGLLLASRMFGGSKAPAPAAPAPTDDDEAGGLLGGLGGLIDKFKNAGHGQVVDSWVGKGPNQPVTPAQVQQSLGNQTISDLARQAGMSEDDLMAQLAQVMPDLVDRLTPQGRMPTAQEIRAGYRR